MTVPVERTSQFFSEHSENFDFPRCQRLFLSLHTVCSFINNTNTCQKTNIPNSGRRKRTSVIRLVPLWPLLSLMTRSRYTSQSFLMRRLNCRFCLKMAQKQEFLVLGFVFKQSQCSRCMLILINQQFLSKMTVIVVFYCLIYIAFQRETPFGKCRKWHFQACKLQNFLGEQAPRPPQKLTPSALGIPQPSTLLSQPPTGKTY